MAFVRAIVWAYAVRAMDAQPVLALAQIAPHQLHEAGACITAWQMEALCEGAMRELDDEALGWFERRLPWGSYGMLARASITAAHLGLALSRWCRHHNLLTHAVTLTLESDGSTAHIRLTPHAGALCLGSVGDEGDEDRQRLREFGMVSLLRNIHGLACWLIDTRIELLRAQFPFAAPAHAGVYPLLFTGVVAFDAPEAAISFDAHYLTRALARDEAQLHQMLQRALPLTVRPYRRDRPLVQRVRQLLASDPAAMHSGQQLAVQLHVSTRTLHRQLKDEGTSLQHLKDQMRQIRATELLQRTERPMKQIALAVGFTSEKSFIRAFRAWTGLTPALFRSHTRTV